MITCNLNTTAAIEGAEGTAIKQIFHPHNTMLGIRYSIIQCSLEPGKKSKPHKLKSAEVYIVTRGHGILHVDEETSNIDKNIAAYVPPYTRQFIENTGDGQLEFLCIVDPAWRREDEIFD